MTELIDIENIVLPDLCTSLKLVSLISYRLIVATVGARHSLWAAHERIFHAQWGVLDFVKNWAFAFVKMFSLSEFKLGD